VLVSDRRSEDSEEDRLRGVDFASRALEASSDDPGVLANVAIALSYFGEDVDAMIALIDRALTRRDLGRRCGGLVTPDGRGRRRNTSSAEGYKRRVGRSQGQGTSRTHRQNHGRRLAHRVWQRRRCGALRG